MGDSPCMMGDFQNDLISGYFVFFGAVFLHRTTLNDL